jgi:hypothetical protein
MYTRSAGSSFLRRFFYENGEFLSLSWFPGGFTGGMF